jgi:hypothetical protein
VQSIQSCCEFLKFAYKNRATLMQTVILHLGYLLNSIGEFNMRFKLGLLLMILASILAACGGGGDTESTDTPSEGGGDSVELSETFTGDTTASGTLTFNYPSGWTQAGTADALSLTNTDAGAAISVSVTPGAAATAMGSTPTEILASFASNTAAAAGITYSEPEEVTFGSNSGAIVSATGSGTDYIIAIVDVSDSYVFLSYTAPEGEMESNRATLEAIASSISLGS